MIQLDEPPEVPSIPTKVRSTLKFIGYLDSDIGRWWVTLRDPDINESELIKNACRYLGKP